MIMDVSRFSPLGTRQKAATQLALDYMDRRIGLQYELMRTYSEMALNSLRTFMTVESPQGLQNFFVEQSRHSLEMFDRVRGDVARISDVDKSFMTDWANLLKEDMQEVVEEEANASNQTKASNKRAAA